MKQASLLIGSILIISTGAAAAEVDVDTAESLARKSKCFTCHAVDKQKDGPPYKEIAAEYKGKADAEDKLYRHLTTKSMVKVDGKEEEHAALKSKNEAEIRNVVRWILSR